MKTSLSLLLLVVFGCFATTQASTTPVFEYSFPDSYDGDASPASNVITDLSAAGNHATMDTTDRALVDNRPPGFDSSLMSISGSNGNHGATNAIDLLNNTDVAAAGGFRMDVWFQWEGTYTNIRKLIDYAGTEALRTNNNQIQFILSNSAYIVGMDIEANRWYHAVAVFDTGGNTPYAGAYGSDMDLDGTMYLYIDDVLVDSMAGTKTGFGDSLNRPIGINRWAGGGGDWYQGIIFNPSVYLGASLTNVEASNPSPANRATDVSQCVTLSWNAGEGASSHDVYFGTDESAVTNASRANPLGVLVSQGQPGETYPATDTLILDFGQTYYWRIDEVDGVPTAGDVWQFTVEPFARPIPIAGITATADSNEVDQGPEKTLDLVGDLHSTDESSMWRSSSTVAGLAWIEYDLAKVYNLHEMQVWNYNGTGLNTAIGVKEAVVEYSTDGITYSTLGTTQTLNQAPGTADYAANTTIDLSGIKARYVRITANSNWGEAPVFKFGLSEVRFFYVPMRASNPAPTGTNVPYNPVLTWKPGRDAVSHEILISTSRQHVDNGTAAAVVLPADDICGASYSPLLEFGKTYYWKVNEIGTSETWEGDIWSFSTAEYLVVDDMTSYGNIAETGGVPGGRIWYVWRDGEGYTTPEYYAGNDTGSVVDMNSLTVHDTPQSLKFFYDSDGSNVFGKSVTGLYSEITALTSDLGITSDWTVGGIRSISLWFYGDAGNATTEQLYIKVNGSKILYDGDMADVGEPAWHEWNIDLAQFGVNLWNITQISIGFGNEANTVPGGSGFVFLDDIRLYPARCRASVLKPSADLDGDCRVDFTEISYIVNNWLLTSYEIEPQDPGSSALAGHWTFDNSGDLGADATGNNNGTVEGDAAYSADAKVGSGSLALDGDNDFIDVNGGAFFSALDDNGDGFTVAAWVKFVHISTSSVMRVFSTNMTLTGGGWGFGIRQSPSRLRFTTYGVRDYDAGTWMDYYLPDDDQWTHVAAVYKSDGDVDFYVGGIWVQTVAGDFTLNDTDGYIIGGIAGASGEWFNGLIDDLRIYNTELSQGQVGWLAGETTPYMQDLAPLMTQHSPGTDYNSDGTINFADFASVMEQWLDELLWPL